MDLHALLLRQLKRVAIDPHGVHDAALRRLLQRVSRAYDEHDQENYLLARSQDLASLEVAALHATVRADHDLLERTGQISGVGGWQVDLATQAIELTDQAYRIFDLEAHDPAKPGVPRQALSVDDLGRYHTPEARRLIERAVHEALGGAGGWDLELPLITARGRAIWARVIGAVDFAGGRPLRIAGAVQDITARRAMEAEVRSSAQRLRTEARTDRLTGLPNRAFMVERLERAVAQARGNRSLGFALLFIDFDRFKLVNDTLGHDAGDRLLQQIAQRLRKVLRPGDVLSDERSGNIVARFGGDEFVVLLAGAAARDTAASVARRLLDTFAVPYQIDNQEIHSTASIGIALSGTIDGSAGRLLRNADLAMYEAKRAGRANFVFFDQDMQARVSRAVQIEEGLRRAIGLQQLALVYQPIVDLQTGRAASVEALLRWQHPELGSVSPAEFIPIAEESGLIVEIGEWVLRRACMQWRRWQQQAPGRAPATMSVNLSRVQMSAGDQLLALVAQVQRDAGIPPGGLQLEVSEREVMRSPAAINTLMKRLRAQGVKLAMDDFGTGASSLGCLRDLPFDVIKIDKSFIDDRSHGAPMLAVIHATVSLIENLGMVSVAEGIEEEIQVGILQSLGCRCAQGYYFSRPVPPERLLDALLPNRARALCDDVA